MNLDLINKLFNDVRNKGIQNFIEELQNYMENTKKEGNSMLDISFNGTKITTKFRDKMLLERKIVLNDYANNTMEKGEMYYIYSKNSQMENGYNLCICNEDKSSIVIEEIADNLPNGAVTGSVLRKNEGRYILDEEATGVIEEKIENLKARILEEQKEFLSSNRIEGHIYELSEKNEDRVWLFDVTKNAQEGIEEIEFPEELLNEAKEGDLFIFKEGEYKKY